MRELLKCQMCEFSGYSLSSHIYHKHKITCKEYSEKFGKTKFLTITDEDKKHTSEGVKKRIQNDPELRKRLSDIQKNGASIFTVNYWIKKGYSEEDAKKKISEIQKKNSDRFLSKGNPKENSPRCKEYWLKRGKSDEESKKLVSELQAKYSAKSSKFTGHVRTEESKEKISISMKKRIDMVGSDVWLKHFGKFSGKSKAEVEFYNYIKNNIDDKVLGNVPISSYIVDVIKGKKIIEFNGDFWHANPFIFEENDRVNGTKGRDILAKDIWEKDRKRTKFLNELGYEVLVIWEHDWNKNKNDCIEKIKNYLL